MESSNDFVAISAALGMALYVALGLDYIALYECGFSQQSVCKGAVLVALLIGIFIAIEFFSRKLRKVD